MGRHDTCSACHTNARPCLMSKTSASHQKIYPNCRLGPGGSLRAHTRLLALSSFFVKQHHLTLTALGTLTHTSGRAPELVRFYSLPLNQVTGP